MIFVTPVAEDWLEKETQWVDQKVSIWWLTAPQVDVLPLSCPIPSSKNHKTTTKNQTNMLILKHFSWFSITWYGRLWIYKFSAILQITARIAWKSKNKESQGSFLIIFFSPQYHDYHFLSMCAGEKWPRLNLL